MMGDNLMACLALFQPFCSLVQPSLKIRITDIDRATMLLPKQEKSLAIALNNKISVQMF